RIPARFPLQLQPEDAAQDAYLLVLSGVPAGTTLSGASRIANWLGHVVAAVKLSEPARNHHARMVCDSVRSHDGTAADQRLGCRSKQGLDCSSSARECAIDGRNEER